MSFYPDFDAPLFDLGEHEDYDEDYAAGGRGRGRKGGKGANRKQSNVFHPKMDRFEKEGKVICTFELPGLAKKDVDVALHDNILSINGTTLPLKQFTTEDCTHVQRERSYSSFSRNLRVPHGLKETEIKGKMENGVLRLEFPAKPEDVPGKKIEIA